MIKSLGKEDYPILERYMRNYHSMVDTYKNKPINMDELQYMKPRINCEGHYTGI